MGSQILDDVLLLSELGVEELGVGFELVGQPLLWLVQKLCLVANPFKKSIINFRLDVVIVVFSFIVTVIIKNLFAIGIHFPLFLVQIHHNIIILFLFFRMDALNFLHLLSEGP
jgi:hypothetical protein